MSKLRPSLPSARRIATWSAFALLIFAIALPAYAGPKGKGGHSKKSHSSHGKNIKDTSGGSWGTNGHQPSSNSFPQGHSSSDPDGNSNGGADKPGGIGGVNSDRDGNNGCGNDTDREDDNNGWCGRKPHKTRESERESSVHESERQEKPAVKETEEESPAVTSNVAPRTRVLGERLERSALAEKVQVLGVTLARTGLRLAVLMLVALGLLATGFMMYRSAHKEAWRIDS